MLSLKTNLQSITASRWLSNSTSATEKANQKLSSGQKINQAADDAAGLAISEKLRAEIRAAGAAKVNSENAVSLVQTAEGGLNEISSILARLKELSIQAASDTIGKTERSFLQKEYGQLKDEIDRIASVSEFNGTPLLAGNGDQLPEEKKTTYNPYPLEIQVGSSYFKETDSLETEKPQNVIRIDLQEFNAMTEGQNSLDLGNTQNAEGTRIDEKAKAQESILKIDYAINKVSEFRAYLGAIQNRLESTTRNLGVYMENVTASESRVRDADIAEVSADSTKSNILRQAGASVLAQANMAPQVALKLLG